MSQHIFRKGTGLALVFVTLCLFACTDAQIRQFVYGPQGNAAQASAKNADGLFHGEATVVVKRMENVYLGEDVLEIQEVSQNSHAPVFMNGSAFVFSSDELGEEGDKLATKLKFYDLLKRSMKTGEPIHVMLDEVLNNDDVLRTSGYRSKTLYWISPVSVKK